MKFEAVVRTELGKVRAAAYVTLVIFLLLYTAEKQHQLQSL